MSVLINNNQILINKLTVVFNKEIYQFNTEEEVDEFIANLYKFLER